MRWIVPLILLISAPAYASPQLLFLAATGSGTAFTINGNSSISSAGTTDTGTESIATGAGNISVKAYCTATTLNLASVYLVVDGATVATLSCDYSEIKNGITLSHTVTAGTHNIRVYGMAGDIDAYFSADTFRKPTL